MKEYRPLYVEGAVIPAEDLRYAAAYIRGISCASPKEGEGMLTEKKVRSFFTGHKTTYIPG